MMTIVKEIRTQNISYPVALPVFPVKEYGGKWFPVGSEPSLPTNFKYFFLFEKYDDEDKSYVFRNRKYKVFARKGDPFTENAAEIKIKDIDKKKLIQQVKESVKKFPNLKLDLDESEQQGVIKNPRVTYNSEKVDLELFWEIEIHGTIYLERRLNILNDPS